MNENKLCDYGCGQGAKYQLKNGKWCCTSYWNSCANVKLKNSNAVKKTYQNGRESVFKEYGGWNKGLTKESDKRLKEQGQALSKRYCNGELVPHFLGKHHTKETKDKLAKHGGYRKGSGRGKSGWYKGYWCDSSWELAWVIYNLEHDIKFERNHRGFEYEFEGEKHKYTPDFKMEDDSYVEIKGWMDEQNKAKIVDFKGSLIILGKDEIKPYLDYAKNKYSKDYIKLYKGYVRPERQKFYCEKCGKEHKGRTKYNLCRSCSMYKAKLKTRKVERPSKEELESLIYSMPMTKIGSKYGVSDNTIRTWCRLYKMN